MKKIHSLPLFIIFFLLLNSSFQIINLENQDTNVNDGLSSLITGDQSENNVFLEKLTSGESKDETQENGEDIESAEEEDEDDEEEEDDEDEDGIDDETEILLEDWKINIQKEVNTEEVIIGLDRKYDNELDFKDKKISISF